MNVDPEDASAVKNVFTDLSAFQRDVLWALTHEDGRKGLALKTHIEDYYDKDLNHSRLYQNLDKLVNAGLIEKSARDRRTNEYALTEAANHALTARRAWQVGETNK